MQGHHCHLGLMNLDFDLVVKLLLEFHRLHLDRAEELDELVVAVAEPGLWRRNCDAVRERHVLAVRKWMIEWLERLLELSDRDLLGRWPARLLEEARVRRAPFHIFLRFGSWSRRPSKQGLARRLLRRCWR